MIGDEISTLLVDEGSPADIRLIADLALKDSGIALLAIHRGTETLNEPDENVKLQAKDVLILLGSKL